MWQIVFHLLPQTIHSRCQHVTDCFSPLATNQQKPSYVRNGEEINKWCGGKLNSSLPSKIALKRSCNVIEVFKPLDEEKGRKEVKSNFLAVILFTALISHVIPAIPHSSGCTNVPCHRCLWHWHWHWHCWWSHPSIISQEYSTQTQCTAAHWVWVVTLAYSSCKLKTDETGYSTFNRELLAIYLAIKYLSLTTKNSPLHLPHHLPHQIRHFTVYLRHPVHQGFIKGSSNVAADALSCLRVDALNTVPDYTSQLDFSSMAAGSHWPAQLFSTPASCCSQCQHWHHLTLWYEHSTHQACMFHSHLDVLSSTSCIPYPIQAFTTPDARFGHVHVHLHLHLVGPLPCGTPTLWDPYFCARDTCIF